MLGAGDGGFFALVPASVVFVLVLVFLAVAMVIPLTDSFEATTPTGARDRELVTSGRQRQAGFLERWRLSHARTELHQRC